MKRKNRYFVQPAGRLLFGAPFFSDMGSTGNGIFCPFPGMGSTGGARPGFFRIPRPGHEIGIFTTWTPPEAPEIRPCLEAQIRVFRSIRFPYREKLNPHARTRRTSRACCRTGHRTNGEPLARITQDNTKAPTPRIEDQGFYLLEIAIAATLFYFIGITELICCRRSVRHSFVEFIPVHCLAETELISERDEVLRDCLDRTFIFFQDVSFVE